MLKTIQITHENCRSITFYTWISNKRKHQAAAVAMLLLLNSENTHHNGPFRRG